MPSKCDKVPCVKAAKGLTPWSGTLSTRERVQGFLLRPGLILDRRAGRPELLVQERHQRPPRFGRRWFCKRGKVQIRLYLAKR